MFDETAVLDAAAAQFRAHGFADTSTEQLCEAAGVRRSSLYNTFVSKEDLFVRALERYTDSIRERQSAILDNPNLRGGDRIRAILDLVIAEEREARKANHAAGCMVVHAFMSPDLRERDERIAQILDRDLRERLALLGDAIRAGRIDGSVVPDADPERGAMVVTTVISGLRVTAQSAVDFDVLRQIALDGLRSLLA